MITLINTEGALLYAFITFLEIFTFRDTFFFQGDGPFPGVIDLFGTVGGLIEFRSALLASRGFASLSLAYFAFDDLPKTLGEVDFDYFMVSK